MMMRTASTTCLAAWTTFFVTGAFRLAGEASLFPPALQVYADQALALISQSEPLGIDGALAEPYALLCLGVATLFGSAIIWLVSANHKLAARGEALAAAGLAGAFALWLSATMAGSPIVPLFAGGSGFCFALAVTLGALLFDHMIHASEDESDEAFEMAMREVERSKGWQGAARPHSNSDRGDH